MKSSKYLVPILFATFLFTCSTPPDLIQEKIIISGYNFSKYSAEGFLFTPNEYFGDYESVGLIHLIYTPEANLIEVYTGKTNEQGKPINKKSWQVNEFDSELLLDKIYEACIELGANAFTQMNIETHSESYATNTFYPITINGAKISGFAIRK